MKRLLSLLLLLLLALGLAPLSLAADWSEPYLQNLVTRDVMKGDNGGDLAPQRFVTRSEFAAMLNRAFGFSEKGNKSFADVPKTAWYADDMSIASNQGYMQGDGKGAQPNGNLTREEAVTMLCRALHIEGQEGEDFVLNDERNFANWSRSFINAAVDKHFVAGYPDGSFRPSNNITRGEAAKLLSEVAGEIVTRGSTNPQGVLNGNATIASSGVTMQSTTVLGDLFLTEGVGLGHVALNEVSVNGEFIISGAGESQAGQSSLTLSDSNISNLVVDVAKRKILTLKTDRSTIVDNAIIRSSTYLEELSDNYAGFNNVEVNGPAGTTLNLRGNFGEVHAMSPGVVINLYKGMVNAITVDEKAKDTKIFLEKDTITKAIYFDTAATVTGKGQIESVLINNDGVVIEQLPENIYIRPGVTAKINGKPMGSLDAEMDALEPEFSFGYPKIDKVTPTNASIYYMTNKPGKVYYALYAEGASMPTKEELSSKTTPPKDALKSGNLNTLPEKEGNASLTSMKAGQRYVVYSVFIDLRGRSSEIETTPVETVDNVMPITLSGYPKVALTDEKAATFDIAANKNCSIYWAVMDAKAVAPSSEHIYKQTVSGELAKGEEHGALMNITKQIEATDLNPNAPHVLYVVLRDDAGNMSKTPYKLAFTTKDATPPNFVKDSLRFGVATATAIPVEYAVDEPCTLYWAAMKQGNVLLPLIRDEHGNMVPDLTSPASREIVKNGSGALKSGKSSAAKADTLYKFSISGLEKQTPYDVYFVLEDKSGNTSSVTFKNSKTFDVDAPKVLSLVSEQMVNGNFSVDSDIIMTFTEIVCSDLQNDGNVIPFVDLTNKEDLGLYIRLMDTTKVSEEEMKIKWSDVKVQNVDAKTVLTFPAGSIGEAGRLFSNNNAYRFDLSYKAGKVIRDTTKNQMAANTKMPFKTVPPLTYFTEVQDFDSSRLDAVFYIDPKSQQTGENMYFDIMISADHHIEFELWGGESVTGMTEIGTGHVLSRDYTERFSGYLPSLQKYKDIKSYYYGFKLTKIDTTPITGGDSPLTANVNLKMNAVLGNNTAMKPLRGAAPGFDARLKAAIANNSISSVTAPQDPFKMTISLVDNLPPKMIRHEIEAGDRQAELSLITDKGCTVYYFIRPLELDTGDIADPNVIRAQSSDPGRGIAAGSFVIPQDSVSPTGFTVEGLLPPEIGDTERKYIAYYYLQGKAPKPSKVYSGHDSSYAQVLKFSTKPTKAPVLKGGTLTPESGNKQATIKGSWDSDCTMFYALYPQSAYGVDREPTKEQIMGTEPDATRLLASSLTVSGNTNFSVLLKDLDFKSNYSLFVVGQKYIGTSPNGDSSAIYSLRSFSSRDLEAPIVTAVEATLTTGPTATRHSGAVVVQFSEGLYQMKADASATIPLTKAELESSMIHTAISPSKVELLQAPSAGGADGATQQMVFSYNLIYDGTTITIALDITDKMGNRAGQLKLSFHCLDEEGNKIPKPYWTGEFV